MARSDFSFVHALRVRWSEVDMQAIVFNGNYLNYFDVAFTEYWRMTGLPDVLAQAEAGLEMFARKATVEYHAPARFDDMLDIGVRCIELGRSSMRFVLEIFLGDELLVSGEMTYVYADSRIRQSRPVPDAWRERLAAVERTMPALR
ncbi:MAG: acyl-CoA thioesterase [Burkholderiaceae bacterium]|nr:acyl-CoA thioesterase [Burkholderiaceae bacterium]